MAISMTFTAIPVLAGSVISEPGGTTINVAEGQEFDLSFRFEYDEVASGYFAIAIKWVCVDNLASDNFTIVGVSAEFDNGDPINVTVASETEGPDPEGTLYTKVIGSPTGEAGNGQFDVDITLRAGSEGVAHAPGTDNIEIEGSITITESTFVEYYPPDPVITINVTEWTGGVVAEGKDNAYNEDATGISPFIFYNQGDRPPIVAAERIGSGGVVAGGLAATCRNGRWNDDSPVNPAPYLDIFLDQAFQWMVTGAENVLWYDGYGVYVDNVQASQLIENLTNNYGYTVWGDNTEPISSIDLSNVNILVLPQLQPGYGSEGGDPSAIPDADVTAINSFVTGGGGLLIMDQNDTFGYNFNRVQNKILAGLGFSMWFQHDEVTDAVDSWYNDYSPILYVDPGTTIGAGYSAVTGTENLGTYSICTLAPVPTFDVDVSISPAENSAGAGEAVTFVATVHNTGDAWDTYTLDLTDDLGWPELSFLPKIATLAIYPTDDSHVAENFPDQVEGNGTSYNMYVGWEADPYGGEGWKTRAYLRFDVSSSPAVISATLNAKVNYGPSTGYPSYTPDNMLTDVKAVSGDAWLENELTWNNAPAAGATLDTTMVYDDTTAGTGVWYSWDITSFVTDELAGDGVASLCMLSENKEADNTDCTVWFYTKDEDGTSNDPYIEVTYLGLWTTTTVTLGPCQSATFDLGVIIDNASAYCDRDTLTIDATSAYTETVVGSGSATAHSMGPELTLRGVTVEIHPEHQEAVLVIDRDAVKKRYDPLTFKVIVTNTGDLWDKYVITATDNTGDKMLELWPTELFLQPDKSDFVVLSVTVPEDAVGSTWNEITVTATGTFATFTGDDMNNAAGEDKCTVHIQEAYCVRVDVWPFQVQSATPGSKVRWIARVKNLGNTVNTYNVTVNNVVIDANREYEPAVITVTPEGPIELQPCNWAQVVIDLDVPEGLEMSTRIYVTVDVDSVLEVAPDCYDSAEVEVHVVRGIPPIPQGVIKLEVETEIIAIQVWPTYADFGILDEAEDATSGPFTVRNIGNKPVDVTITGNDAKSSPGELVTTWTLAPDLGLDRYVMWFDSTVLDKAGKLLVGNLLVSEEYNFDLKIQAPSSITVPSRMWTLVNLTAVEA